MTCVEAGSSGLRSLNEAHLALEWRRLQASDYRPGGRAEDEPAGNCPPLRRMTVRLYLLAGKGSRVSRRELYPQARQGTILCFLGQSNLFTPANMVKRVSCQGPRLLPAWRRSSDLQSISSPNCQIKPIQGVRIDKFGLLSMSILTWGAAAVCRTEMPTGQRIGVWRTR